MRINSSKTLPGPGVLQTVRSLAKAARGDLLQPFDDLFQRYGPMYEVRLPFGHHLVMLAHPEAVEQVLRSRQHNYVKGSVYDGARLLLGNGLVTSEGDLWRRQRQLANPAFRPSRLEQYLVVMDECVRQMVDHLQAALSPQPIDAQEQMTRLTMAIAGRTLFGLDLTRDSDRARDAFGIALAAIGQRGPSNLQVPLWLPTPGNLRFRRALRELDAIVYEIIERFRTGNAEGADKTLLGEYLKARDPDTGEGMSDQQLRDEVITLYLAGHGTTASLLTWALYWLGRRPDIAERIYQEVNAQLGTDPPGMQQLKTLDYTSCFINEVLRLYPPAWTIARNAIEDDEVMGYRIPAGAIVMLSPYFAHRWHEIWPDPLDFDPDRFAPDASKDRHAFAYFPFSLGPRICIGMQFSLIEARRALAEIVRRFRIQAEEGPEIGCIAAGTLRPSQPIRVVLSARNASFRRYE